ncbi:antibiotic biosynthesis monooxygenase [Cesiribacter sp. SM1]|uniref:antibiotic biosynthesis monooxygenase family protein n=1 Tax=Cesiribacter sp. SM1 TaxID=2861196 RepID=UPI001CD55DDA|nr:antibiotic biosynthesis monooxygenase [Cesiribacter sp. SM1]
MIQEVALLQVKKGLEHQFEKDFALACKYISAIDGYLKHSLQRCIEQENKYLLLVTWRSLEDHTIGFRQSAAYQEWKALLHHYYDPFPVVEHFQPVLEQTGRADTAKTDNA